MPFTVAVAVIFTVWLFPVVRVSLKRAEVSEDPFTIESAFAPAGLTLPLPTVARSIPMLLPVLLTTPFPN